MFQHDAPYERLSDEGFWATMQGDTKSPLPPFSTPSTLWFRFCPVVRGGGLDGVGGVWRWAGTALGCVRIACEGWLGRLDGVVGM